jgi:hypothetical protein
MASPLIPTVTPWFYRPVPNVANYVPHERDSASENLWTPHELWQAGLLAHFHRPEDGALPELDAATPGEGSACTGNRRQGGPRRAGQSPLAAAAWTPSESQYQRRISVLPASPQAAGGAAAAPCGLGTGHCSRVRAPGPGR